MDVVMLPLVAEGTGLDSALSLLRRSERAGLVVHPPFSDSYGLLYAGDLLRGKAEHVGTLGSVTGTRPVLVLDAALSESYGLDLVRPDTTRISYETMLIARGFEYALAGEAGDTAMIVTLHEEQGETLRSTGGYQCGGHPRHYFPEPRVRLGQMCPYAPHDAGPGGLAPVIETA